MQKQKIMKKGVEEVNKRQNFIIKLTRSRVIEIFGGCSSG